MKKLSKWMLLSIITLNGAAALLSGCTSSESVKVSLVVFEASAEMNVSK